MTFNKNIFALSLSMALVLCGCSTNAPSTGSKANNVNSENSTEAEDSEKASNTTEDRQSQEENDSSPNTSNENEFDTNINENDYNNIYFLTQDNSFFEKIAANPIDSKFAIDYDNETPLEIKETDIKKCEAWNNQIDFTEEKLKGLLNKDTYAELSSALSFWKDYYGQELDLNSDLYGDNGIIAGSMYTSASTDVLVEKSKMISTALLSIEFILSGDFTYVDGQSASSENETYSISPQNFCIEYSEDFENYINGLSLDSKDQASLESLISNTSMDIENTFGHNFSNHIDNYVLFIDTMSTVYNEISNDESLNQSIEINWLKLYAIDLLNLKYLME